MLKKSIIDRRVQVVRVKDVSVEEASKDMEHFLLKDQSAALDPEKRSLLAMVCTAVRDGDAASFELRESDDVVAANRNADTHLKFD
jgi:hypothetical protein